jgi:copper chaperone
MTTQTFQVSGMTCQHCVAAVSQELADLSGVTDVAVDLDSGQVTVTSKERLSVEQVRSAIDEAGYELAGTVG